MINNACMSPECIYYLEPMKHAEFVDHMRLWRKNMPTRFHSSVALYLHSKNKNYSVE
jgi:hypothetical protein